MRCKNCNCPVSSNFEHAYTTNCCPKCGQQMMTLDVKSLFSKMQKVLHQDENDVGDLAVWFVDTYFKEPESVNIQGTSEEALLSQAPPSLDDPELSVSLITKQVGKKPTPIKRGGQPTNASAERANMFAKRAGVDKIKFETLIKDIQGESELNSDIEYSDNSAEDNSPFPEAKNRPPLSDQEIHMVEGLFDVEEGPTNFAEIQKLQKIEQLNMSGSLGKIKRSS